MKCNRPGDKAEPSREIPPAPEAFHWRREGLGRHGTDGADARNGRQPLRFIALLRPLVHLRVQLPGLLEQQPTNFPDQLQQLRFRVVDRCHQPGDVRDPLRHHHPVFCQMPSERVRCLGSLPRRSCAVPRTVSRTSAESGEPRTPSPAAPGPSGGRPVSLHRHRARPVPGNLRQEPLPRHFLPENSRSALADAAEPETPFAKIYPVHASLFHVDTPFFHGLFTAP